MKENKSFDALDNPEALLKVTSDEEPLSAGFTTHLNKNDSAFDIHYELEIGIVLSGKMKRVWDDYTRIFNPGDVWLTGIWEPHGYTLMESPVNVLVFLLRPEVLNSISLGSKTENHWLAPFKASPSTRPDLNDTKRNQILEIVNICFPNRNEYLSDNPKTRLNMLFILEKLLDGWNPPKQNNKSSRNMKSIEPALELVFSSKGIISTSEASKACALSESTFERYFSNSTGMGFARFALNHRLKHAAYMLRKTDSPIKAISDEWGFSDLSHFYKSFKKIFKLTPAAYRETKNNSIS